MKKIIFSVMITLLISGTASAAFNDVSSSHPNFEAINYVQSLGIVEGYEDGTYKPDSKINRAEFTKIIMETTLTDAEIDECTETSFSDVTLDQWFAKYVCAANKFNVIDGYTDGTFKPGSNIVFAEASKILVNSLMEITNSDPEIWYKNFVTLLGAENAIPTSITAFDYNITRGEMAEMIWRLEENITTENSKTYNELAGIQEEEPTESYEGDILAGSISPVLDFNKEDYDKAFASDKLIVLYFYADWCPICKAEIPKFYEALDGLNNEDVIGFRVNYNDNFTDSDEVDLARKYSVLYQHTKVFLLNGERVLKSPESWDQDRYLSEINNFLN